MRERGSGQTCSNLVGEVGFEPTCLAAADFKSAAYAVPPLARIKTITIRLTYFIPQGPHLSTVPHLGGSFT